MSDIKITNRMKAENIGEHLFAVYEPCPKCALHLDDNYDDIDCLCNGSEDKTYEKVIMVPWDTCKDIYKSMRASYERDISAVKVSPYDHIRDRISSPYQHIKVGETEQIYNIHQCASIKEGADPIFEVAILGGDVQITEACDHYYTKVMSKADAIAALNELIHYIESSTDE